MVVMGATEGHSYRDATQAGEETLIDIDGNTIIRVRFDKMTVNKRFSSFTNCIPLCT